MGNSHARLVLACAAASLALAVTVSGQGNPHGSAPDSLRQIEEFERRANVSNPPATILDAIHVAAGMVVGEVGARHGRIAIPLARRVGPGGKVYANDIDRSALALLRERCAREQIANVETVVGKVDDPLFPKGALDMALMVWTYHEVSAPAALLKNLAPALKPGGTVALVEPSTVTRSKVEADAEGAGLTLVKVIADVIPRDNVFILRKK
jgi:ubiquinone/menaquinone biosynthesis C-methylase UbiE